MRTYVKWTLAFFAGGALLLAAAGESQASPSRGRNCADCHANASEGGAVRPGAMEVTGETGTGDFGLGVQKFYEVERGSSVLLSMRVLDGSTDYAVELKGLETGGITTGTPLTWTTDSSPSPWRQRGSAPANYYTQGAFGWTNAATYSFNLIVDAASPVDVYDYVFAVAGLAANGDLFYDEEHFYVSVVEAVPEPSSWILFSGLGMGLALFWRRRQKVAKA